MRKFSGAPFDSSGTTEERRAKYAVGLWLRVCAGSVFLLLLIPFSALGLDFPYEKCAPAFIGLLALILVNAIYWKVGEWRRFSVSDFYVHWAVDLALITTILYGLGGARLPSAITAYILIVITSAVFVSRGAAVLVATGGALAYAGLVGAEAYGVIDPDYELDFENLSVGLKVFLIASPVFMLYLVAYITGTLGNNLNEVNRALVQKNCELAERNEQLDRVRSELDFQSNVLTHDIRSPITAATAIVMQLLRDHPLSSDAGRLQLVLENLYRVEDMVHSLNAARESGESADTMEWVSVADILLELEVEFREIAEKKQVAMESIQTDRSIWAFRGKLVVILRNLVMNALRYVPEGGSGRLRVGVVETEAEWRIFVADNGPGVPPDAQAEIFEMYRRGPGTGPIAGMGVGLALVRRAAREHGGSAWVESDGQTGSTFWVRLPTRKLARAPRILEDGDRVGT